MIDTDKYENMRQLFLDFIDIGEDEPQWKRNLEIYDDLLAEVERLREWIEQVVDMWENCNHEDRTDWFNNFCEVMKND